MEFNLNKIVGSIFRGVQLDDPLQASALKWCGAVMGHVFGRWRAVALSQIRCSLAQRHGNVIAPCADPAVTGCETCGKPVCLGHALVGIEGKAICLQCVVAFQHVVREHVAKHGNQEPPPPTPIDPKIRAEKRKVHLRTLGLKDPATAEEIKDAFRKLAAKWHPDRAEASKKEAAEKKFKEINAAYQYLSSEAAA